jgi:hypothetical protein
MALLGREEESRGAAQAGLDLNPQFTIARVRAALQSDNPVYLFEQKIGADRLRKAGVPE